MTKFNVGDIVVGNDKEEYAYTSDRCICKVIETFEPRRNGKDMIIEVIYHADGFTTAGTKWDVNSHYFDRVIAAPAPVKKIKEMTVSEISKVLGYEVKIVKDSTDEYCF